MEQSALNDEEKEPDDDEWSNFEDFDDPISPTSVPIVPSQLHPAVSLGMTKVSSCYFSIGSLDTDERDIFALEDDASSSLECGDDASLTFGGELKNSAANLFYHDILMNVFTFLNASSLAAFSETGRQNNFEVFYFLQLQLQRALIHLPNGENEDKSFDKSDVFSVSRLASLDKKAAEKVVGEFLDSNSTLRTMPLSHSLVYIRHFLQRNRGLYNNLMGDQTANTTAHSTKAFASAAFMLTLVGAAYMANPEGLADTASFGTELPNMLFRFGFMGSLMGAARQMSDTEQRQSMKRRAESMVRSMQQQFPTSNEKTNMRFPSLLKMRRMMNAIITTDSSDGKNEGVLQQTQLSNPYDHVPEQKEDDNDSRGCKTNNKIDKKVPSGCVSAYFRAIQKATTYATENIKEVRKSRFLALTLDERRQAFHAFIEACSSDESLVIVKRMIHSIDVDGFYQANDDSLTCPLHTAAFHGSAKVINYLCRGIGSHPEEDDGGLCDVNLCDANGWTAMHFAAGNNKVEAAEALSNQPGVKLSIEANNGYTPLQWAERLSNEEVAETLKSALLRNKNDESTSNGPLTAIAQTFFTLIP